MKLQQKTMLIFTGLLILLLIFAGVFSSIIILSSYSSLEQQLVLQDLNLSVMKINDEADTLSAIVSDWGPWDDTWNFVQGNNPGYIRTNLASPETFVNLRLNAVIITNRNGEIVYSNAYDPGSRAFVPVPAELIARLNPEDPLMNISDPRRAARGIILLPDHPMIIAARPIVRTDFSGEPQGMMIMGRSLDSGEVARLAQLTSPSLVLYRLDDPDIPAPVQELLGANPDSDRIVQPVDRDTIAGYALLKDIYGREALVLSISEPRSIYLEGQSTTFRFILIILVAGLVFGLIVMFLLHRLVLDRLEALTAQVHDIGDETKRSFRVQIGGSDEFSTLAGEINRMLDIIDTFSRKVQASETRFRELAGLLPQIVFEMDMEGNIRYVNKAGTEQFGITPQMIGQGVNFRRFLHPDDTGKMERGIAAVVAGIPSHGDVYTLIKPDGTTIQAIVSTSLIRKEGTITGFRGVVVDMTERIRLENKLEESTRLLGGILQASPVGVFRLDPDGHISFVNETFTRITGMTPERVHGAYLADILPHSGPDSVKEAFDKTIRELWAGGVRIRYMRPDKTSCWLSGQTVPLADKEGNRTGWVGTITDVTLQKQSEDALRESEEKYRALTEKTPDILFSADMTGVFTYVSPQVSKYGFSVEDMVGRPLLNFVHPADLDRVESVLLELKSGRPTVSRFRVLNKQGTTDWVEENSSLRSDASGKPIGIYGILRDVTERKQFEDAIDIANKKLNLMNQITRHDILNTITGLLGCVDMMKATDSLKEKDQLLGDIRKLTRVIQQHIAFTREYQEVGIRQPQWQNVTDLIRKVEQNFTESGLFFSLDLETVEIYADPMLEKVFYNLMDNAVRYGETLTKISVYSTISDKGFSIVFEDNGVGVPDAQKREIFRRGVGKNTGMGLFLTAEILAITGITIEETGIYGRGSRFEILIPKGIWRLPRR